jgi:phosphopantothenate synthetase
MTKTEGQMIDPSDMEIAAMQSCLGPLGEYVGSIGMHRPLADYSREEVLTLIDVVVTAYQHRMIEEHERMAERDRAFLEQRLASQTATRSQGRV